MGGRWCEMPASQLFEVRARRAGPSHWQARRLTQPVFSAASLQSKCIHCVPRCLAMHIAMAVLVHLSPTQSDHSGAGRQPETHRVACCHPIRERAERKVLQVHARANVVLHLFGAAW